MKETKHSPAPWSVYDRSSTTVIDNSGFVVCNTNPSYIATAQERSEVNARLISMAPTLLKTLQALVSDWEKASEVLTPLINEESYIKAKEVIQKATEI